jgi:hypothetical protein
VIAGVIRTSVESPDGTNMLPRRAVAASLCRSYGREDVRAGLFLSDQAAAKFFDLRKEGAWILAIKNVRPDGRRRI